jgi:hypothetical protein
MSIVETLVSEARAVRENNIRQLPSIAARRCDAFVPDGAALRACAASIAVEPDHNGCDDGPSGIVTYTIAHGVSIVVKVDDGPDAGTDVRIKIKRNGWADYYILDGGITREAIARALYRGSLTE